VRSSPSSISMLGSENVPRSASVASGVVGTTVKVSAAR
jgi:hypothetical protein